MALRENIAKTSSPIPQIDPKRYGKLLAAKLPRPIEDEHELERRKAEMLSLEDKDEDSGLAPEEKKYLELLTILVMEFEREHFPIENLATPLERLRYAMEQKSVTQSQIAKLLDSRSLASAILSGKRGISRESARKLAEVLAVPADMFL